VVEPEERQKHGRGNLPCTATTVKLPPEALQPFRPRRLSWRPGRPADPADLIATAQQRLAAAHLELERPLD
jgi:hypothetical protein